LAVRIFFVPKYSRKTDPNREITPSKIFIFKIWVKINPEVKTRGTSVNNGVQATFAPARMP